MHGPGRPIYLAADVEVIDTLEGRANPIAGGGRLLLGLLVLLRTFFGASTQKAVQFTDTHGTSKIG